MRLAWRETERSISPIALVLLAVGTVVLLSLALPAVRTLLTVNQAGVLLNKGRTQADPKNVEQALTQLDRALASGERLDTSFWRTYGAAAARVPSERSFRRLLAARQAGRLDRWGQLWLGEVSAATGHWDEAHQAYARIDATNLLVGRGERALDAGDRTTARNWFSLAAVSILAAQDRTAAEAGRRLPNDPAASDPILRAPGREAIALLRIGRGFLALGLPGEATGMLERAISAMHVDPPGLREQQGIQLSLARALTETLPATTDPKSTKDRALAVERIRTLVQRAVDLNRDSPTYLSAGRIMEQAGDPDRAIALLEEAVRLAPSDPRTYLALGQVLRTHGLTFTERDLYARGLTRLPDSPELLTAYAMSLYRTGTPEQALPALETAAKSGSRDAYLFAYLGDAYRKLGRSAEAQDAYEQGLRRNPEASVLRKRLALFTHPGGMLR